MLTGVGTLFGCKYAHTQKIVRASVPGNPPKPREVSVTEDYLVGPLNAWNVARRLLGYYTSAKTVKGAVVLGNQLLRPGMPVTITDVYGEENTAVISRMDITASATVKAGYEAVEGFSPGYTGPVFTARHAWSTDGTYTAPVTGRYRLTIIGGGQGGQGGMDGTAGYGGASGSGGDMTYDEGQSGGPGPYMVYQYNDGKPVAGLGGEGGAPGSPGKVLTFDIDLEAGSTIVRSVGSGGSGGARGGSLGSMGGDTTVSIYDPDGELIATRSSAEGVVPPAGVFDILGDTELALPGRTGYKGGDGGATTKDIDPETGDPYYWGWGSDVDAEHAGGFDGSSAGTYAGGSGGNGIYEESAKTGGGYEHYTAGGGGGGGAAYGNAGGAGGSASNTSSTYKGGNGGAGANAAAPIRNSIPGGGGHGGNGGGGGGNAGGARIWNVLSLSGHDVDCGNPGSGGNGSSGGDGGKGYVVIYTGEET